MPSFLLPMKLSPLSRYFAEHSNYVKVEAWNCSIDVYFHCCPDKSALAPINELIGYGATVARQLEGKFNYHDLINELCQYRHLLGIEKESDSRCFQINVQRIGLPVEDIALALGASLEELGFDVDVIGRG